MGSVSLECKVWSVKCGMQSTQCRGKFNGPPSAPERTFARAEKSTAVSGESSGRHVNVHTQHDNGARPTFHTASSVKRAKLWGLTWGVKCIVRKMRKRTG